MSKIQPNQTPFDENSLKLNTLDLSALKTLIRALPTPPPQGWERVKLQKVCKIIRGVTYDKSRQSLEQTQNIILTADNITAENTFELSKMVYLNFEPDASKKLYKNDIFMCFSSGSLKHIGKVAFIKDDTPYYAGGFMGILRPLENIKAKFLFYAVANKDFKQDLENIAKGANINNLSNEIENLKIPLPKETNAQESIIKAVEWLENAIFALNSAADNLAPQKAQILQKYLF